MAAALPPTTSDEWRAARSTRPIAGVDISLKGAEINECGARTREMMTNTGSKQAFSINQGKRKSK